MRLIAAVLSLFLVMSACQDGSTSRRNTRGERNVDEPKDQPQVGSQPNTDPEPGNNGSEPLQPAEPLPTQKPEPLRIVGRQLQVDGQPYLMRAVCWNPVRKGQRHPDGIMFRNPGAEDLALIEQDLRLMSELGVNTLRTYEPVMDDKVLALIQKYKLRLIVPVFNYFATPWSEVEARVKKLKDHPAVLWWEIGNEWNYELFYSRTQDNPGGIGAIAAKELVKKAIEVVRAIDQRLPIATNYGELPPKELIDELSAIDIWGINVYSGLTFGNRFEQWRQLSAKPLYLGEFGADAINMNNRNLNVPNQDVRELIDESSQAEAVIALTKELQAASSALAPNGVLIGGAIFEWNDEWWKDGSGRVDAQDIGGIAPGGGPFPDRTFNEEWWGLVDIDRKPRSAYIALKSLWKN